MKNDLKNKIRNAFQSETPDFQKEILSACENQSQEPNLLYSTHKIGGHSLIFRRVAAVIACLVLFVGGISIGYLLPENQPVLETETYVYFDVNPSIELSLDENNIVLSCRAINDDAERVLNSMKLENVQLKTALNAIVGSMYVNGYLSLEDNAMLVSVDTNDTNNTNGFLSYIMEQVNEVFVNSEMKCAIIAQGVKVDADLKQRADEYGISVGKMHLLDKMVDNIDYLTENNMPDYANMSIRELNMIYTAEPNGGNKPDDELISGDIKVDITMDNALLAVLSKMKKTMEDVEDYNIFVLPSKYGETKVIYAVTLKLYNDSTIYKYEVDCKTGEVVMAQFNGRPDQGQKKNEGGLHEGAPHNGF